MSHRSFADTVSTSSRVSVSSPVLEANFTARPGRRFVESSREAASALALIGASWKCRDAFRDGAELAHEPSQRINRKPKGARAARRTRATRLNGGRHERAQNRDQEHQHPAVA